MHSLDRAKKKAITQLLNLIFHVSYMRIPFAPVRQMEVNRPLTQKIAMEFKFFQFLCTKQEEIICFGFP